MRKTIKRLASGLLSLAVVAQLFSTVPFHALAVEGSSQISSSTVWSYLDDGTDPALGLPDRTDWADPTFNDSAWNTATGSFGAKNGQIADLGGGYTPHTLLDQYKEGQEEQEIDKEAFFFRTTVNVADASQVKQITGSVIYDDSATVYLNGTKIAGFDDEEITSNLQYGGSNAGTPKTGEISVTDPLLLACLVDGENTVAVEIHNGRESSSDVYFDFPSLVFSTEVPAKTSVLLDETATWKYLDDNTDPAGDPDDTGYNRASWAAEDFSDAGWKSAAGPFGSKRGSADLGGGFVANTILDGCDGNIDTFAYFFRTTFTVTEDQLAAMKQLQGTVEIDDGATVYINGTRVAGWDDAGVTQNLQYAGHSGGDPVTESFATGMELLHEGENTIAVIVYQDRPTSSDAWFLLTDLSLTEEEYVAPEVEQFSDVSMSIGADETQRNLTWYAANAVAGQVLVAEASDVTGGEMPADATAFTATSAPANEEGKYSNQVTITGLKGGSEYAYQMVNGENKSEIYTFTTGDSGAFSFALAGDPQIGAGSTTSDIEGWDKTLGIVATNEHFADVDFLLSAGDQVNSASDEEEYDGYLDHEELLNLPVATVIGNHDSSSNAYGQHFNVPNETEKGTTAAGSDYWFTYNNVLFLVLNSNNRSTAEHKAFMEEAIAANPDVSWKIVTFHHSIYSVASHATEGDILDRRNELVPVFKELDIDVVLMGHDHVYVRTYMMNGLTPITESDKYTDSNDDGIPESVTNPDGILYVTANSASGSKFYTIQNQQFPYAAVQNQERVPNISRVDVSDTAFTITTYRTSDMSVVDTFAIYRTPEATPDIEGVIISQVYGGGNKGEGPISHSFIELYNTTDQAIDLAGTQLTYSSGEEETALNLTGTIPAHGSYLVRCNAEANTTGVLELDSSDQDWAQVINNKAYRIALVSGDQTVDSVAVDEEGGEGTALAEGTISKQKSIRRKVENGAFVDTNNNANDFEVIVYEDQSEAFAQFYAPKTAADGAWTPTDYVEPAPEPVAVIEGFENDDTDLEISAIGRYDSGMENADGAVMEIVDYNKETGYAYAVNGMTGELSVFSLEALEADKTIQMLDGNTIDVKSLVQVNGFTYGDMTSVAISPDGKTLAAAIQADGYAENGRVALFTCENDGTLKFVKAIEVGVQPDMVTFTPDGSKLLTANEGEPRNGYGDGAVDPAGSVSVIDVKTGSVSTVGFTAYDSPAARQALVEDGIILMKDTDPSVDFEPEYIACTDDTAYVTLQEANAIAVLNLTEGSFTGIYSVGFEDYNKTPVDIDKKDEAYSPATYESLRGIRMPDAIALYTVGGVDYLLTANEGDAREWGDYLNEDEKDFGDSDTSPTGAITADNSGLTGKVVFFQSKDFDGLDETKDYLFGGRSFTLFRVDRNGLTEVFTSGDDFEAKTAAYLPDYFNCSNDDLSIDDRSGKKGPEPETVTVGKVNGRTYAFVTLERIGGVMVYDITNPRNVTYVNYINSRDFSQDVAADDSPEGLKFIPASQSPTGDALLLAACEVGGTVAVYELNSNVAAPNPGHGNHPSTSVPDEPDTLPFVDVSENAYYYDAVKWAVENGVTEGISASAFGPDRACTRAQMVTFLWRAAGCPVPESTSLPFSDVSADDYYYDAVAWAVEMGITAGTSAEHFSPDATVTRGQTVTFLYRYAGEPEAPEADFTDVSADAYYADAVAWASAAGVTEGVSATAFAPDRACTRAQIVTFLYRSMA